MWSRWRLAPWCLPRAGKLNGFACSAPCGVGPTGQSAAPLAVLVFILLSVALICLYAIVSVSAARAGTLGAERYGLPAAYLPESFGQRAGHPFPLAICCCSAPMLVSVAPDGAYFLGVATPVLYWTQSRARGRPTGRFITNLLLLAWRKSRALFALALVAFRSWPRAGAGWLGASAACRGRAPAGRGPGRRATGYGAIPL